MRGCMSEGGVGGGWVRCEGVSGWVRESEGGRGDVRWCEWVVRKTLGV